MMSSQMEWGHYFLSVKWKFSIAFIFLSFVKFLIGRGELEIYLKKKERFSTNTIIVIINQWKIKKITRKGWTFIESEEKIA